MIFNEQAQLRKEKVSPEEIDPNTKYIGLEHIGEGTLSLNGFGYSSDVNSSKAVFEKGDILFGKLRPYFRKVIIAPFDGICSTDIWVVKPKNGIDRNFLFYWMASQDFVDEVTRSSEGTRMPRAKWEVASKIEIPDIDSEKQKKVGKILYTLDQKIHLNQQTNETLEAMAQAIFKSWFVDFDPVRAKIAAKKAGRDPEKAAMAAIAGISLEMNWDEIEAALQERLNRLTSDQSTQLRHTASLFPDELVGSELGDVPKGWGYSTIDKEFEVVNGQSPPGSSYNENGVGESFYQGRTDFGFRFPTQRIFCTEPKRFAKKGDTLLSVRAPVGDLNIAIEDCCIGRGLSALRHKSGSSSYTYYAMKVIQTQIESYEATGTVFGSINQKQLKALDTISPDDILIEEFHRITAPIDSQIMNQEFMVRELSKLRDTLLPKLISGEVGVESDITETNIEK